MKRLILGVVGIAVFLAGCSFQQEDKAGGELIRKARADYKELDSAKVIMTNMESGEIEQTFTFKYDEKDTLIYSYYGKSENSEYAQYNNGVECFTYENGEFTYVSRGDKEFAKYTRDITHPQADEGLLIYTPGSIKEDSETQENGVTHVHHEYDVNKISAEAENGIVTGFSADYYFDGEDLLYFTETTFADVDGTAEKYEYKVEITEKNSVQKVENTTSQFGS